MDTQLHFVPRHVRRKGKTPTTPIVALNSPEPGQQPPPDNQNDSSKQAGQTSSLTDQDVLVYIRLALSDYALSSEDTLKKTFLWNLRENDGWIPVNHILQRSVFLAQNMESEILTENRVIKALRSESTQSKYALEIRLQLSQDPSSSRSHVTSDTSRGAYEMKWRNREPGLNASEHDWAQKSLYLENIPVQHRNILGLFNFVRSMLSSTDVHLEAILFPANDNEYPSTKLKKCRGFAFVVLSNTSECLRLNELWPWTGVTTRVQETSLHQDATRFGFRTLLKTAYVEMEAQYLEHRQNLIAEIAAAEDAEFDRRLLGEGAPGGSESSLNEEKITDPDGVTTSNSPFPLDCLLFVRNVHPHTNKTTLRKLLTSCLPNDSLDTIDYVDYNKGMDTCYIRVPSPKHAHDVLMSFPATKVQKSGLDDVGGIDGQPIQLELVQGRKEELYWEKVPEKVRKSAVTKCLALLENGSEDSSILRRNVRQRKRRKV
ncbi:hypothetical protein DL96DRAFT_1527105 [Flagelloscypha sp. PMI_526]|nr:hypothetical protein DL96DRAFT_1527105 [Flagelloscypha sp. PMI_526]